MPWRLTREDGSISDHWRVAMNKVVYKKDGFISDFVHSTRLGVVWYICQK